MPLGLLKVSLRSATACYFYKTLFYCCFDYKLVGGPCSAKLSRNIALSLAIAESVLKNFLLLLAT